MEIEIFNNYSLEISFNFEKIISDVLSSANQILKTTGNISLILVDGNEIKQLNKQYRNLDYATDVLSFEEDEEGYLGEIFINIDKVTEQAHAYNHSLEREFAFLLCHGVLHLNKYDHLTKQQEEEMFAMQEVILNNTIYRRENKNE